MKFIATSASAYEQGLALEPILSTMVYSFIGIAIMVIGLTTINGLFNLNLRKELIKDHNVAFGILFGCMAIAIGIIIAGTIMS